MDDMSTTADGFFCSLPLMSTKSDTTTFLERFTAALTAQGIDTKSPTGVGRFLELNKQTVARWLDGGEPSPEMLFHIADKTHTDARWLATGKGGMTQQVELSPDELEAITQIYRNLQGKALRKWIRDGHELVEMSAPVGSANPFARAR